MLWQNAHYHMVQQYLQQYVQMKTLVDRSILLLLHLLENKVQLCRQQQPQPLAILSHPIGMDC